MCACIYRGECSYIYEYLRLYCVSKKYNLGKTALNRKRLVLGDKARVKYQPTVLDICTEYLQHK
jgi:hypothetical protein